MFVQRAVFNAQFPRVMFKDIVQEKSFKEKVFNKVFLKELVFLWESSRSSVQNYVINIKCSRGE